MMDTVKRLMAGRSAAVERSIDKAVDYLGRSTDTLRRQAEAAKARARALDPDNPEGAATGGTPTRVAPATDGTRRILPADDTVVTPMDSPPPVPPPPVPPSPPAGGSALRGDLVDPPEASPGS